MNHAAEHLKRNDIDGALAALQEEVRSRPQDAKLRVFLFQLLCVTGEWKRAVTQLKLCAELDRAATPMAQTYREAILCEVFREKVFAGEKDPLVFGEPETWIASLAEALKALARGEAEQAAALRERAFEAAPAGGGEIEGRRFEWIADADPRLGSVLEVILNGRYFWMPFDAIAHLAIEPPADLRDFVWTPATITLRNGGTSVALIPTRYPHTHRDGGAEAKLARVTDWVDVGGGAFAGIGQRLLASDAGENALMEVRSIRFDAHAPGPVGAEVPADG